MAESLTIRRDNPLFIRYGTLVERNFSQDSGVGMPMVLFPSGVQGGGGKKHLAEYADPNDIATAQKWVDKWRAALLAEGPGETNGEFRNPGAQSATHKLQEFRDGLQSGKEVMLEENPFYELTCLFYRANRTALKNAFTDAQRDASDNPPRPIKVSRSYRHIWGGDSSATTLQQKLLESLAKIGSLGKLAIGLILFAGSTLTTAKGVIDLVQLPGFVEMFGNGLAGVENESARTTFALFVGLVLSSVILDFKSRLFQGTAEVGQVFRGFYHAFCRYPRWVFVSLFLTMISIWTNYDGIVLLMSKTEDLAFQWQKIESQVNSALGDEHQPNLDNPGSLRDLHAVLANKAARAIEKFKQVPEDEQSGAASSGIAKIGPRYWAKHFIVHGGYIRGRNNVSTVYKDSTFVRQIDGMLVESGLDLNRSLDEKIHPILAAYEARYRETEAAVQRDMGALSAKMTFKDYSLDELLALFNLESYHVNAGVQKVVASLEENKNAFAKAAQEISQLADAHIALLREVDKVGTPVNNEYTIEVAMGIPQVDAIDRLKQGEIPMAQRRSLAELKALMMERYGVAVGSVVLFLVLFMAVFMDLSDPILYSAMIARWGRRDRHFLDENVVRFQKWEDMYVQNIRKFFVQPEILATLPKLSVPKIQAFHSLYNHFLEDVDPHVKDISNRDWWEMFRFWFLGLFLETRIGYVEMYNARQTALLKCLRAPETYAPRLLNRVFPGLLDPFKVGVDHFDFLFDKTFLAMKQDAVQFEKAMLIYAPDLGESVGDTVAVSPGMQARFQSHAWFRLWIALRDWLYLLFWRGLIPPEPDFPLTRISRLRSLALSNFKSRGQINYLADFVPSFRHFLRDRLFIIKREVLLPLSEALSRIPNGRVIEHSLRVHELRVEYARIERGLMELLGLSQFQGIQVSEQMVRTIIEQSEIDELINIYLRRTAAEEVLESRIAKMESRLARAFKLIKDLVDGQDTLIFTLTTIRREHLSPINITLSKLQTRVRIEESLGLRKMKDDLTVIEKCLLELWDAASPIADISDERVAVGESDMGAIIDLVRRNAEAGKAFDMIDYVKQLEVRIASAHKTLDSTLYQLAMVDKITTNVLGMLDHSLELVELIHTKDGELQEFPAFGAEVDQKKLDFLTDNRLFFRTVSLQVDALRARINDLGSEGEGAAAYSIDLARDVEKQAIMLRYFLKNTMDYLDGKRDSIGLTAALAELRPRRKQPEPEPIAEVETIPEPVVERVEEPKISFLADAVRDTCANAKQILLDMSLLEWDLLKKPVPPQNLLREIQGQQEAMDKVGVAVEGVLSELEHLSRKSAGNLDADPQNRVTLQTLQDQSAQIFEQLSQIFNQVAVPAFVDRRLAERCLKDPVEQQNLVDRVRKAESASRRGAERTVLQSQIELTLPGGQKIFAASRDMGARAICLESTVLLDTLVPGTEVSFRLLSDAKNTFFPGRLLRARGTMLVISLVPGSEAQFINLVRAEILREREGKGR